MLRVGRRPRRDGPDCGAEDIAELDGHGGLIGAVWQPG